MKDDTHGFRLLTIELDCEGAHQLIEGSLRGAIAVPAAKMVVLDASDPRRQNCEYALASLRQERQQMLGHKRRANGIDPKAPGKMLWIKSTIGLLRLERRVMEDPCRHQDEAQRCTIRDLLSCRSNAELVLDIDPSYLYTNLTSISSRTG